MIKTRMLKQERNRYGSRLLKDITNVLRESPKPNQSLQKQTVLSCFLHVIRK